MVEPGAVRARRRRLVERRDPIPAPVEGGASWLVRPEAPRGTWSIARYRAGFADGSQQTGVPREGHGIEFTVIDEQRSEQDDWVGPKGYPCGPSFQGLRDVCLDNPFRFDIHDLALAEITAGCSEHLFCPDDPVTRGQMAAFVVSALGLPAGPSGRFDDVASSHPFHDDIAALAAAGITRGCDPPANDHYCPDVPVTRAQMATFLYRAGVVVT